MRLQQWAANRWLRPHQTTRQQVSDLLAIVDRDLADSMRDLSPDWQFGIACNAVLKLCTILPYASGYRPEKNLGPSRINDADYLDTCRAKRNTAEYDATGTVSQSEADELREFTRELHTEVLVWLKNNHPSFAP